MAHQPPPAPPAAQSPKGPNDTKQPSRDSGAGSKTGDATGKHDNVGRNTTHQGHQQDR